MRSETKFNICASDVHAIVTDLIQRHLKFQDYSKKCLSSMMLSVLLFAASRIRSIHDACQRLRRAPSDETIRQALKATLPDNKELHRRINSALADRLPKSFFRSGQRVAMDLTEIPYHGKEYRDEQEIRRGKPKSGTSHFHVYATAYVCQKGHRFTLAVVRVLKGEKMESVVKELLRLVRASGVKVRFLLLDKGFFTAEVVRYLQRARCPFLMPAFARGRKRKTPLPGSLHELASRKQSGWASYRWQSSRGTRATVQIAISCKNYAGQRERRGRRTRLYAHWGLTPGSTDWVSETYRKRFGIETTYRQMNEVRIRTSSRDPLLRFLFVAIALILRNVWVWCHLNWLALRYGRGIIIRDELLRLGELMLWLQDFIQQALGLNTSKQIPRPPSQPTNPNT